MSLLWTLPLAPALWLILGAVVLLLAGDRWSTKRRTQGVTILVGLALLAWGIARLQSQQAVFLWRWQTPLEIETALGFQMDGFAWLAGLGILLVVFAAVIVPGWSRGRREVDPLVWVLFVAGLALFAVMSITWLTLLIAWTLIVLCAGFATGGPRQGAVAVWTAGALAVLFLLAAPLFNSGSTLETAVGATPLNSQAQLFLVLGGSILLAAYPFHVWVQPAAFRSTGRQLALQLLPALAALHLLGRFDLVLLGSRAWVPLNVVALLGSALAAWAVADVQQRWVYVLVNRATWALVVLGLAGAPAPEGAVFPLLVLALGGVMWALARAMQAGPRARIVFVLAVILLYGFPFTPGFAPNLALGKLTGSILGLPGWLLVLLAQTLFVAALLRREVPAIADNADASPAPFPRVLTVLMMAVGGLALLWGVFPGALARSVGVAQFDVFTSLIAQLRSAGWVEWITLIVPFVVGLWLARFDRRFFEDWRDWRDRLGRVAGLSWLYGGVGRVGGRTLAAGNQMADLIEGAGQFGWVVLIIVLILLLVGRGA